MDDIQWGDLIEVNGKMPVWLKDDVDYQINYRSKIFRGASKNHWPLVEAIRLPSDHFAYTAIAAGFEPWGGGEKAPDDWDGGEVLLRYGARCLPHNITRWAHVSNDRDIIGYRKRASDAKPDRRFVTVECMTEREARSTVMPDPIKWLREAGIVPPSSFEEKLARRYALPLDVVQAIRAATPDTGEQP